MAAVVHTELGWWPLAAINTSTFTRHLVQFSIGGEEAQQNARACPLTASASKHVSRRMCEWWQAPAIRGCKESDASGRAARFARKRKEEYQNFGLTHAPGAWKVTRALPNLRAPTRHALTCHHRSKLTKNYSCKVLRSPWKGWKVKEDRI